MLFYTFTVFPYMFISFPTFSAFLLSSNMYVHEKPSEKLPVFQYMSLKCSARVLQISQECSGHSLHKRSQKPQQKSGQKPGQKSGGTLY